MKTCLIVITALVTPYILNGLLVSVLDSWWALLIWPAATILGIMVFINLLRDWADS